MKNALAVSLLVACALIGCRSAQAAAAPAPTESAKPAATAAAATPVKAKAAGADEQPKPAPAPAPKVAPHAPTAAEIAAVKGQKLQAIVHTPHGDIHLRLLPDVAPIAVANFVQLAESKFYDGTAFHRVVPGFVIQGGDPQSRPDADPAKGSPGQGGPGYQLKAEPGEKHTAGTLAMADSGLNTAGSQFYVTLDATPSLDGRYTAFGHVLGDNDLTVARAVKMGDRMTVEIVRGK